MSNTYKIVAGVLLVASLAACNKQDATDKPEVVAAAPEDIDAVTGAPPAPIAGTSGMVPQTPGLAVFDLAALRATKPARMSCSIDKVNGKPGSAQPVPVVIGGDVEFRGWVTNPQKQTPPSFAVILSNGDKAYALRAETGLARPDVAKALGTSELANAGYAISAKLDNIEPGLYQVSLLQDTNSTVSRCTTKIKLSIGG